MLPIYYKYSKYFENESLTNNALRISSPFSLNDPFENIFHKNEIDLIETEMGIVLNPAERHEKFKKGKIEELIEPYGVVSLSKKPDNILMWSHYADEHKGICIGFKGDLFESMEGEYSRDYEASLFTPRKIEYKQCRPTYSENNACKIRRQLLIKSTMWKYESEYRCILPMTSADQLKILNESKHKIITNCLNDKLTNINSEANKYSEEIFKGEGIKSLATSVYYDNDYVFLKNIPFSKIASIHLGCRIDEKFKREIISVIKKRKEMSNDIKLYECKPSNRKFKLICVRIDTQ